MRLGEIGDHELTAEQREIRDGVLRGPRKSIPAPLRVWLRSPELARHAEKLGAYARYGTSLPPRLSELAILVTARVWSSEYEWYAHRGEAVKAGLAEAVIEAIRERRSPPFSSPDEQTVYDYARALHEARRVPEAVHRAAVAALGEKGVVDLVGILGYYTLISMTLNAFEIPLPDGATPQLAD